MCGKFIDKSAVSPLSKIEFRELHHSPPDIPLEEIFQLNEQRGVWLIHLSPQLSREVYEPYTSLLSFKHLSAHTTNFLKIIHYLNITDRGVNSIHFTAGWGS